MQSPPLYSLEEGLESGGGEGLPRDSPGAMAAHCPSPAVCSQACTLPGTPAFEEIRRSQAEPSWLALCNTSAPHSALAETGEDNSRVRTPWTVCWGRRNKGPCAQTTEGDCLWAGGRRSGTGGQRRGLPPRILENLVQASVLPSGVCRRPSAKCLADRSITSMPAFPFACCAPASLRPVFIFLQGRWAEWIRFHPDDSTPP